MCVCSVIIVQVMAQVPNTGHIAKVLRDANLNTKGMPKERGNIIGNNKIIHSIGSKCAPIMRPHYPIVCISAMMSIEAFFFNLKQMFFVLLSLLT